MKPLVSMPSGIGHGLLVRVLAATALAALGLVVGRVTGGARAGTAAGDCAPAPSWPAAQPAGAAAVLAAVNAHRATRGLAPLRVSGSLTASATWKARHMAAYNYMAHDDPAPPVARSFFSRVAACGYAGAAGENVARWYPTAAAVVQAWLADAPHRANIEGGWSTTGIAVAGSRAGGPYWVEGFGGGDAPPPPPTTTGATPPTTTPAAATPPTPPPNTTPPPPTPAPPPKHAGGAPPPRAPPRQNDDDRRHHHGPRCPGDASPPLRRPARDRARPGGRKQAAAPRGLRRAHDPRPRAARRRWSRRLA